jgi:hypothetical protein
MRPARRARPLWLKAGAGTLLVAAASALAATPPGAASPLTVEPSEASRCLVVAPGAAPEPTFPPMARVAGRSATVKVLLRFAGPDQAPELTLVDAPADAADFVEAVRVHARDLRVPCMTAGAPTAALQVEFAFLPDNRPVTRGLPNDAAAAADQRMVDCIVHQRPGSQPHFPESARRGGVQGRLIARLTFESADGAPQVEVLHRPATRALRPSVHAWAQGLRMPCLERARFVAAYTVIFVFAGEQPSGFGNVTFPALVSSARGIRDQALKFDTNTMGCPLEVRWQYRQPQMANAVGVIGQATAQHRPLLEWLENVELDLPTRALDAVWGDTVDLVVPCIVLDLQPK